MKQPDYARVYPEYAFGKVMACDGSLQFYSRMHALVKPDSRVLEVGSGTGFHRELYDGFHRDMHVFRGKVQHVLGIDFGDEGAKNTALDEFRELKGAGKEWPVESGSVDLCFCDWVIEHVEDVDGFFQEARRVLKPGGHFCFRTPNRFHYSSMGASMIPARLHYKVRQILGHPHTEDDVFPTYYRANTRWRCLSLYRRHKFAPMVIAHRGASHLLGMGYVPGVLGKWMEELSPSFFWHEIHAFGRAVE
ncbi:MAG: methyltransferase domain-containing protein [Candidatus Methylacidiphilales bacterium]